MANVNIYKRQFLFFIFAKVRPVLTKVIDTPTHTQRYAETDMPIAIGEILYIYLKCI